MVVNDQGKHWGTDPLLPASLAPPVLCISQLAPPYLKSSHPVRLLSRQPLPNHRRTVVKPRQNWGIRHPLIGEAHSGSLRNRPQIE